MLSIPLVASGIGATPVLIKAAGELHRTYLESNVLARQGQGTPADKGEDAKLARQRASGIKGGIQSKEPQYMGKVPGKKMTGDLRKDYEIGGLGNATSSRGILEDILSKVPRQTLGTDEYKKIARPQPKKAGGYGNQSFTP